MGNTVYKLQTGIKRKQHLVWPYIHNHKHEMKLRLPSNNLCEDQSRQYVDMMALLVDKRRQ